MTERPLFAPEFVAACRRFNESLVGGLEDFGRRFAAAQAQERARREAAALRVRAAGVSLSGGAGTVPGMTESSEETQPVTTEVPVETPAKITQTTEVEATPETVAADPDADAGGQEAEPANGDEGSSSGE